MKKAGVFMQEIFSLKVIARIHSDFPDKFGIPRQSGLIESLKATIVFEPEYRNPDALRGLDGYSYIWIIWQFSEILGSEWSPTVRPPRLGGNKRMGVFATRSPFRPNPIGLSSVRLERIDTQSDQGPILHISGADLMDGTPIYDIKPYLPYVDSHLQARGGFAFQSKDGILAVEFPSQLLALIPSDLHEGLIAVLAQDPRPAYQGDPERIYGMKFSDYEIRFTVNNNCLNVCDVFRRK